MCGTPLNGSRNLQVAEIGVIVKGGIFALTGTVDSYMKKRNAENATKDVLGVTGFVENVVVNFCSSWGKSDTDVVKEVVKSL